MARKNAQAENAKEAGSYFQSEDNKDITAYMMALMACPKIDLGNPTSIEEGIKRYMVIANEHGFKPALTSFAVCAHQTREMIGHVRFGRNYRNERSMELLTQFAAICEAATREGMLLAKNPAGWIFEMKACYGWTDAPKIQVEHTITDGTVSLKQLEQKYLDSIVVDDHELVKVAMPTEIESTAEVIEEIPIEEVTDDDNA